MKYIIYYNDNGRITGILSPEEMEFKDKYEISITYDNTIEIDSDLPESQIFFQCSIVDGKLSTEAHKDVAYERELKRIRSERAPEYPSIGDQLDSLFHAGVFPKEMEDKIKEVKNAFPKPNKPS